jgi:uncharacterized membrane protein
MTGHIVELLVAALLFVGSHFFLSSSGLRAQLVARLGERGFRIAYSILSILLLIWMVIAYRAAPDVHLWYPPPLVIEVPLIVMPFALLFLVCGLTQLNPTSALPGGRLPPERPAPGILAVTRHPVLWAFGLWALSHLVASGELGALILFASIAFLALYGTRVLDEKKRQSWPAEDWQRFSAATSNLPFAAMATSRNQWRMKEIGWWRLAVTALLYVVIIGLHNLLGVPVVVDI